MPTPESVVIENFLRIADKQGLDVDFTLNHAQRALDNALTGRDIVPKARQEGISSYVLARFTVKCLGQRNTRAVVISHDKESTQRMLAKVRYYLRNFKGPSPIIKNDSKNEITFPKTNSAFYIGTAGARKFGRGDTITHLHCSEVAYWPDPKEITTGLFQAVPLSGELIIESTGNGVGNWYHQICMRAAESRSRYKLHFFDWQSFPEYTLALTPVQEEEILQSLSEELEEPELIKNYKLTPGQVAWRRMKLEELSYDLKRFKQEYPLTLDECFQASGRSIFQVVRYVYDSLWKRHDQFMFKLEGHPKQGRTYVLGADVSAGVEQDRSVCEIICLEDMEQVGEWISNKTAPDVFAVKVAELGVMFNNAFIVVENNNHGILTMSELSKIYPMYLIYKEQRAKSANNPTEQAKLTQLGHRTTVLSKPLIIGKLRKLLVRDLLIHSEILRSELSTFVEDENGLLGAEEGCFDDTVIAMAKATIAMERAAVIQSSSSTIVTRETDPFSIDAIINELNGRGKGFPIKDQAIIDGEFSANIDA